MKRESVSGLKHADAPFLYFFARLANLLLSASNSTGFTDTLKSLIFFLKKIVFDTNRTTKVKLFYVNVICDWPTKTCCAAVVGINVYNILGNSVAHFRLGLPL